jgi:hypothetical protein
MTEPDRVRLFVGITYGAEEFAKKAVDELVRRYGKLCLKSPVFDFNFTDYYNSEMGPDLKKFFAGFENPVKPGEIAKIKSVTNSLEESLGISSGGSSRRRVNIDPGYVEKSKVVLVSRKNRSQRIYLKDRVYAEVTLFFKKKGCHPLPWTYADYRTELACSFFTALRNLP